MFTEASSIFLNLVRKMEQNDSRAECIIYNGQQKCGGVTSYAAFQRKINIEVAVNRSDFQIVTATDESYQLDVATNDSITTCYINAQTYFGARHALETLTQLMVWDDRGNSLVMLKTAKITDKPVFPHRGLLIDTSRRYINSNIIL